MDEEKYIFREYNFDNDVYAITTYLYDEMRGEEGIKQLLEGDKFFLEKPDHRKRYVVEYNGELHSSAVVVSEEVYPFNRFSLYSVVTSKQMRGSGITSFLLKNIFEILRRKNARFLLTSTSENNNAARNFFKKIGFIQYGSLPNGIPCVNSDSLCDEILYYYQIESN
ncbi:MAG: GNAT family N-acetyltransferase [Candidatus Heimdallarchaeota archaeon]|nr:GNAT family N-acetyltransferase [Candidatus Heimdallarchaeota archaeon]